MVECDRKDDIAGAEPLWYASGKSEAEQAPVGPVSLRSSETWRNGLMSNTNCKSGRRSLNRHIVEQKKKASG